MANKILFYSEVPTVHLDELHPLIDGHFVIATECLKDEAYFHWYKKENRPGNTHIMLDNGMFEEGKPLTPQELYDIAEQIQPDVVFAPDQVGNLHTTLGMTEAFLNLCENRRAPWQVGVIPQGKDPADVVLCHEYMTTNFAFEGPIGISFLNDRWKVIELMNAEDAWCSHPYHFLGMYNLEEVLLWPDCVTSCDTIKPFKAAYHGYELEQCPRGLGKWNTKLDYYRTGNGDLLMRNLARMHQTLTKR